MIIDHLYVIAGAIFVAVQDGTKCGDGKVCKNYNCVSKSEVFDGKISSVCGNGVIESGEECDCGGMMQECGCCDPNSCMFIVADEACVYNECGRCTGKLIGCSMMFGF